MVCLSQELARLVPVPLVGVDAADDDIVLEHHRSCDISDSRTSGGTSGPNPRQANNTSCSDTPNRIIDDLPHACAFDNDIGLESHIRTRPV